MIHAIRLKEACNDSQGRRLAAAGGTEEGNKFFISDVKIEVVENGLTIKADRYIF
jgi:hypothetical protein